MEPCEMCGRTDGIQGFGIDNTPLCPLHYAEAERNYEGAVRAHVNREISMDDETGAALDDIIAAAVRRLERGR